MLNFTFSHPTQLVFGLDTINRVGELSKTLGNKILLHYGQSSIKKSGLYDKVMTSLTEAGIEVVELGGVVANPVFSLVLEGIKLCKEEQIEGILAVGGGSVMDSAKAIAAGVYVEDDYWNYFMHRGDVPNALPLGIVSTLPATGSETSPSSVITNEAVEHKRSINSKKILPKFSIVDPKLHVTLPAYQTACGISDIMSHLIERYFTHTTHVDYTDRLLEASFHTLLVNGPLLMKDPNNLDARSEVAFVSLVAHNGLLGGGREEDWASHRIEHELSNYYNIAHGAGLAIIMPAWMRYVYKENPARFEQFARRVFKIDYAFDQQEQTIVAGIDAYEKFLSDLYLPTSLTEAGILEDNFEQMTDNALINRGETVGNFKKLNKQDIINIYRLSK
ncbi:MAG: iron-containing alcohol dehydrogenase [Erysipelothrix sp.]|nr:iron-containing alcohol dehydrogenase [Erysipelothrix sp.]